MAWWIVREEIEHLQLPAYRREANRLRAFLENAIGHLYRTKSVLDSNLSVPVKSFFWVKTQSCKNCRADFDLFAGYLLAQNVRHPNNVLVCANCGDLNEVDDPQKPGTCMKCDWIQREGNVSRGKAICPNAVKLIGFQI